MFAACTPSRTCTCLLMCLFLVSRSLCLYVSVSESNDLSVCACASLCRCVSVSLCLVSVRVSVCLRACMCACLCVHAFAYTYVAVGDHIQSVFLKNIYAVVLCLVLVHSAVANSKTGAEEEGERTRWLWEPRQFWERRGWARKRRLQNEVREWRGGPYYLL